MRGISKLKQQFQLLRFRGSQLECPICRYHAKDFLPAGLYQKRLHSKCPQCGSLERHRGMMLLLQNHWSAYENPTLLHFAPERCFLPVFKQLLGSKYHTSEYNPSVPATHHYDIQKIDAPDHSFNMVICSHVLEHVPNDHAALQEIIRILKPGGRAFIQVPMWPSEKHPTYENPAIDDPRDRIIHFGQWDHLRIYGHDVLQTIQNAGFKKVERIHPLEYFKPEIVALNQLRNHGGVVDYTFVAYA